MKNQLESEEEINIPQEGGIVSAGIFGDVDVDAMTDKLRRTEDFKRRTQYHEVIPCMACSNCIELRKFAPDGRACTIGWYCYMGELAVSQFGTCKDAHMRANGRRRVVYDTTNAPLGFEQGMVPILPKRYFTNKQREQAAIASAREMYRGGSSSYVRPDGNKEAVGSGVIPRSLRN